jgi:hypothetical protein
MMSNLLNTTKWLLVLGLLFLGVVRLNSAVRADVPGNVGLLSFELTPLDNSVRVEWSTATELDTAGFRLQRGTGDDFDYLENIGFVISQGSPTLGADYEEVDDTAVNGQTYTYKLIEVESNGSEHELDSKTVTVDVEPTPTSIIIGSPTATPAGGDQATATSTRTPTVTVTAAASPTTAAPTPTRTPGAISASPTQPAPAPTATATRAPILLTALPTLPPQGNATAEEVESDGALAFAQVEPEATMTLVTGYPGSEEGGVDDSAYPGGTPLPTDALPTAYIAGPESVTGNEEEDTSIIGSQSNEAFPAGTGEPNAQIGNNRAAILGRTYLWGGFIVALLIFATGVFGAIILFTRKRE